MLWFQQALGSWPQPVVVTSEPEAIVSFDVETLKEAEVGVEPEWYFGSCLDSFSKWTLYFESTVTTLHFFTSNLHYHDTWSIIGKYAEGTPTTKKSCCLFLSFSDNAQQWVPRRLFAPIGAIYWCVMLKDSREMTTKEGKLTKHEGGEKTAGLVNGLDSVLTAIYHNIEQNLP